MTSSQQRAALHRQIWAIANDVRGAVDGWDFKQYVLGALFYRFISENFADYIEAGDDSLNYAEFSDNAEVLALIKEDAIKTKGYFIYPSQLFSNVAAGANTNDCLNTDLASIFNQIEASASGYPSEQDIKGLFADFDTTSNRLGNTVKDKNTRLAAVLKGVAELDFGGDMFGEGGRSQIDLFGDAYEFLISNYAANAGKSGGEFFTPQHVSKLIAQLAMHKQTSVNKIFDPACGSGSLLLQAKKHFDHHIIEDGFFGQEINHTTYNLARMNMFLHNINYDKFNIQLGNTLTEPHFADDKPFDAIVSNPPYVRANDAALDALHREPRNALAAGDDGLDAIRILARDCGALLEPGGVLLIEHGAEQRDAVAEVLCEHGWTGVSCHDDYAGLPRITVARRD